MDRALPRLYVVLLLVIAVIVVAGFTLRPAEHPMQTVREPKPRVSQVVVEPDGNGMQGAMGQLMFRQDARTTGVSPDTLRFRFKEKVDIHGVLVSVDIGAHGLELVEFAVGINQPVAYGTEGTFLFHVSDANEQRASKIDEHIWFPEPFTVGPDDYVGVGAWLYNGQSTERSVSPEIIVYYSPASR